MAKSRKYTLALPDELLGEIKEQASKESRSISEVVRRYLRFGMIAARIEEDPDTDLVLRERVSMGLENGQPAYETRYTRMLLL